MIRGLDRAATLSGTNFRPPPARRIRPVGAAPTPGSRNSRKPARMVVRDRPVAAATQLTPPRGKALFRGQYAAVTLPESLDMSVLGRDITNLFAVIVDRPGDFLALLGQRHQYTLAAV